MDIKLARRIHLTCSTTKKKKGVHELKNIPQEYRGNHDPQKRNLVHGSSKADTASQSIKQQEVSPAVHSPNTSETLVKQDNQSRARQSNKHFQTANLTKSKENFTLNPHVSQNDPPVAQKDYNQRRSSKKIVQERHQTDSQDLNTASYVYKVKSQQPIVPASSAQAIVKPDNHSSEPSCASTKIKSEQVINKKLQIEKVNVSTTKCQGSDRASYDISSASSHNASDSTKNESVINVNHETFQDVSRIEQMKDKGKCIPSDHEASAYKLNVATLQNSHQPDFNDQMNEPIFHGEPVTLAQDKILPQSQQECNTKFTLNCVSTEFFKAKRTDSDVILPSSIVDRINGSADAVVLPQAMSARSEVSPAIVFGTLKFNSPPLTSRDEDLVSRNVSFTGNLTEVNKSNAISSLNSGFTAPCSTAPCSTAPCSTAPCSTAPCLTAPCSTAPCSTAPCSTAPCSTAPCSTAPSSTAPISANTGSTAASSPFPSLVYRQPQVAGSTSKQSPSNPSSGALPPFSNAPLSSPHVVSLPPGLVVPQDKKPFVAEPSRLDVVPGRNSNHHNIGIPLSVSTYSSSQPKMTMSARAHNYADTRPAVSLEDYGPDGSLSGGQKMQSKTFKTTSALPYEEKPYDNLNHAPLTTQSHSELSHGKQVSPPGSSGTYLDKGLSSQLPTTHGGSSSMPMNIDSGNFNNDYTQKVMSASGTEYYTVLSSSSNSRLPGVSQSGPHEPQCHTPAGKETIPNISNMLYTADTDMRKPTQSNSHRQGLLGSHSAGFQDMQHHVGQSNQSVIMQTSSSANTAYDNSNQKFSANHPPAETYPSHPPPKIVHSEGHRNYENSSYMPTNSIPHHLSKPGTQDYNSGLLSKHKSSMSRYPVNSGMDSVVNNSMDPNHMQPMYVQQRARYKDVSADSMAAKITSTTHSYNMYPSDYMHQRMNRQGYQRGHMTNENRNNFIYYDAQNSNTASNVPQREPYQRANYNHQQTVPSHKYTYENPDYNVLVHSANAYQHHLHPQASPNTQVYTTAPQAIYRNYYNGSNQHPQTNAVTTTVGQHPY